MPRSAVDNHRTASRLKRSGTTSTTRPGATRPRSLCCAWGVFAACGTRHSSLAAWLRDEAPRRAEVLVAAGLGGAATQLEIACAIRQPLEEMMSALVTLLTRRCARWRADPSQLVSSFICFANTRPL